MLGPSPYALASPAFRFPALARAAGRAPVGGPREALLATLLAARLCAAVRPPVALDAAQRARRAAAARDWLGTHLVPAIHKAAVSRVVEASAGTDPASIAAALAKVTEVTAQWLDRAARLELEALTAEFRG